MLSQRDDATLDDGPRSSRPGTARMCALTRAVRPVDELIRFVLSPDGEVIADLKRRLPGRGLWLTGTRKTVSDAAKRGTFPKGFKRECRVSATFAADLERLLVRSALDALAIAAKGRQVVSGFSKVENTLKQGGAVALLHASDGAADGLRKLGGLARSAAAGTADGDFPPITLPLITLLSSDELSLALGRTNVIHAALLAGPASGTFLSRCQALARYRTETPGETAQQNSGSKTRTSGPQELGLLDG